VPLSADNSENSAKLDGELPRVAATIGYSFRDSQLLTQALTHRSFGATHNERLEFLGDGVLSAIIASELYRRHTDLSEGELSRLRAHLVREESLADLARNIDLHCALRLGEGEARSGGRMRASILADALEALIGAVFLDGGFDAARLMIERLYGASLAKDRADGTSKDPKTELQEFLQAERHPLPVYEVVATLGAAHSQTFEVDCIVSDHKVRTRGVGSSRRRAEQEAARQALVALRR
jgi:ribonuclease III